jgi:hypothetical protein
VDERIDKAVILNLKCCIGVEKLILTECFKISKGVKEIFLLFNSEESQECLEMKDLRGSPDPKEPRVMWSDVYLLLKTV